MDIIDAIILGVIEGMTEFLPISSTGHLILGSRLLGLEQTEFLKTFQIAIQLGAILSVVALYTRRLIVDIAAVKRVVVAFVPTAIIGALFYPLVKGVFFESNLLILAALFFGGIFLIIFERRQSGRTPGADGGIASITFRQAALIGTCQSIAMIPGVSRAAATIVGGLWMGISRRTIVEFSFLLAVPTMAGATFFDILQSGRSFESAEIILLFAGFAVSFLVAMISIVSLLRFIERHGFSGFGWYRIAASAAFFFFVIA